MFKRKSELEVITYRQFRQLLSDSSIGQVKHKPQQTLVVDTKGRLLALMQAATVDSQGRCQPVQYYAAKSSSKSDKLLSHFTFALSA